MRLQFLTVAVVVALTTSVNAADDFTAGPDRKRAEAACPWGYPVQNPWNGEMKYLARNGYVSVYDDRKEGGLVPLWVAYEVNKSLLEKDVKRKGKYKKFRPDPDLQNAVLDDEYLGFFDSRGFARGHLAPWAVMGGDRDGDGKLAKNDDDDAKTFFEANYLSNIAPQHHAGFNGAGGIWFKGERFVQDQLVEKQSKDVYIMTGCIFGVGTHEAIGNADDNYIWVPAMFYKIVAWREFAGSDRPEVLAFLFPHHRKAHGDLESYLVTVDVIEALSGLDFFSGLPDELEINLEDTSTFETWKKLTKAAPNFAGGPRN